MTVTAHTQWRGHLISRIGGYCSYCEMKLNDLPQVEHVVAKVLNPTLILDWYNLLLACGACNRTKSKKVCSPQTHYFPDSNNTYLAFAHRIATNPNRNNEPAAFITINPALSYAQQQMGSATIHLCGLNRDTTAEELKAADLRWRYRYEACVDAFIWKKSWQDWGSTQVDRFLPLLLTVANKGFFSVWFHMFQEVEEVRMALIRAFPGTAQACFDEEGNPVWRNLPQDI